MRVVDGDRGGPQREADRHARLRTSLPGVRRMVMLIVIVALGACAAMPSGDATRGGTRASAHSSAATPWSLPGPFSESTTRADFEAMFGAGEVELVESRDEDGHLRRGLVLFPRDPRRRAHVTFHDHANLAGLASIEVRDADSLWRGKHGVRIGMSLADVVAINGKRFGLSGFDEQRRLLARDQWSPAVGDDATLGTLDVAEGERLYFGVEFGVRASASARDLPTHSHFPSDDPRWPLLLEVAVVTAFSAWSSLDDEWQ